MATPAASGSHDGTSSAKPSGSSPASRRSNRALRSGLAAAHSSNDFCHSTRASPERFATERVCSMTSSGTSKDCSGSKPSSFLIRATASSPSAAPWEAPVFMALGAGYAMTVRTRMKVGRCVSALASATARSMASTSSPPSTSMTCQP